MNLIDRLKEYFISSRKELQLVSWPTREETLRYTLLVVGISIVFGIFFGLFDFGLTRLVESTITSRTTIETPASSTQPETPIINPEDIQVETAPGSGEVKITPVTPTSNNK